MGGLFLDTSGWFAALSPKERGHKLARAAYAAAASQGMQLITTAFVVAEMHTLMLRWRDAASGERFLALAFDSGTHIVVPPDAGLLDAAVNRWIRRFADHRFSLCDAVSFEVMKRERLSRALAFDRHFQVAGFEIIP